MNNVIVARKGKRIHTAQELFELPSDTIIYKSEQNGKDSLTSRDYVDFSVWEYVQKFVQDNKLYIAETEVLPTCQDCIHAIEYYSWHAEKSVFMDCNIKSSHGVSRNHFCPYAERAEVNV